MFKPNAVSIANELKGDSDILSIKNIVNWEQTNLVHCWNHSELLSFDQIRCALRSRGVNTAPWVTLTRAGSCGEFSDLFTELANDMNISARSVVTPGEDHEWNEVLLNGTWVAVDSSTPGYDLPINESKYSGWNLSIVSGKKLSYVSAIYPNGTIENITSRYTKLSRVIVKVTHDDKPVQSNVTIYSLSLNQGPRDTGISCITDQNGSCTFLLGSTNYLIKAVALDYSFATNKTEVSVSADNANVVNLQLGGFDLNYPVINLLPAWLMPLGALVIVLGFVLLIFWIFPLFAYSFILYIKSLRRCN